MENNGIKEVIKAIEAMKNEAKSQTIVSEAVEAINKDGFRSKKTSGRILYLGHWQALTKVLNMLEIFDIIHKQEEKPCEHKRTETGQAEICVDCHEIIDFQAEE